MREQDGIPKRKTSLAYSPKTAPLLLDDAIQTQLQRLHAFPEIQALDPPRASNGRGGWREPIQHHQNIDRNLYPNDIDSFESRIQRKTWPINR